MPAESSRAVFLSYASQDAGPARRICAALRDAGIEVWFDQSELRGGDAWDQNIRQQIKECALFMPIISANTQARHEGYFRLEWRLADQRTHLMGKSKAFLLPVCIDETRDAHADVPDSFLTIQWMRLPGGEMSAADCERVKSLLGGPQVAKAFEPRLERVDTDSKAGSPSPAKRTRMGAWAALVAVIMVGVTAAFLATRKIESPAPSSVLRSLGEANSKPNAIAADKSIAVLPFVNQSDDKENTAFFSDGMHEDILTSLANIRDLRVISRTSVMEYRGTTKKIPQIARELGVAYILEGSVRRAGTQVRITGQLIRASNDEHLWARSYDRELTPKEMFAIQAALATEIAAALHAVIAPETRKLLERRPTENLAAYDLYLQGRDPEETSEAGLRKKATFLQNAVTLDPNFAEAWAALASTHASFVYWDYDHTPQRLAQADIAMAHAVRLAPESPEVIFFLGRYAFSGYRDFARAITQFEKLIQLQPNNAEAFTTLGFVQRRKGQWREALDNFRRATELDPSNVLRQRVLAGTLRSVRRWSEALAVDRRIIAMRPDTLGAQATLLRTIFEATGSTREANEWLARLSPERLASPGIIAERRFWAQVKGDYVEWKRFEALEADLVPDSVSRRAGSFRPDQIGAAWVHAANGDLAAARARLGDLPAKTRSTLELQPANAVLWSELAVMEALLGEPEDALRDARKAVELMPESVDSVAGSRCSRDLAVVYAWTGKKDLAIAEIARLLRTPSGTSALSSVHVLRIDPSFAPLHGDPKFEALLKDPKNHAPLF